MFEFIYKIDLRIGFRFTFEMSLAKHIITMRYYEIIVVSINHVIALSSDVLMFFFLFENLQKGEKEKQKSETHLPMKNSLNASTFWPILIFLCEMEFAILHHFSQIRKSTEKPVLYEGVNCNDLRIFMSECTSLETRRHTG